MPVGPPCSHIVPPIIRAPQRSGRRPIPAPSRTGSRHCTGRNIRAPSPGTAPVTVPKSGMTICQLRIEPLKKAARTSASEAWSLKMPAPGDRSPLDARPAQQFPPPPRRFRIRHVDGLRIERQPLGAKPRHGHISCRRCRSSKEDPCPSAPPCSVLPETKKAPARAPTTVHFD